MLRMKISDLEKSRLTTAIGIVFDYDERWLEFFYSHTNGELRLSPDKLVSEARCFSHGEQVLLKVALDLFTNGHRASISEILDTLDWENLLRVLLGMMVMRDVSAEDLACVGSCYEG